MVGCAPSFERPSVAPVCCCYDLAATPDCPTIVAIFERNIIKVVRNAGRLGGPCVAPVSTPQYRSPVSDSPASTGVEHKDAIQLLGCAAGLSRKCWRGSAPVSDVDDHSIAAH